MEKEEDYLKNYIVGGETLACSLGASTYKLKVTNHNILLGGKKQANLSDGVGGFISHLFQHAAGQLHRPSCTPACSRWVAGKALVELDSNSGLLMTYMNVCPFEGIIRILDNGQ